MNKVTKIKIMEKKLIKINKIGILTNRFKSDNHQINTCRPWKNHIESLNKN